MKTSDKDKGSLTPQEYEEIYFILNEYDRLIRFDKINEPFYIKDIRVVHRKSLKNIMKKMYKRMSIEYPNSFV